MKSVAPTSAEQKTTRVRYIILAMIFIVSTLNYASRATLSMAGSSAQKELGFDARQLGYLFSAFGYTYVVAQIPAGWLLDRFGSKKIYALSILTWSIFTFLQGFAGAFHATAALVLFFALRLLLGLAEAPAFPGNSRIVAAWFPASERGGAAAVFNASQYFSPFLFLPLSGWIATQFGWRWVFFVTGALGFVAVAVWMKVIYSPTSHPFVSASELDYIERGGALVNMEKPVIQTSPSGTSQWSAVGQLLGNRMLLGVYVAQFGINTITVFFGTWFPLYLVHDLHMSILKAGFTASLPALCGFAGGILGGFISDALLRAANHCQFREKSPSAWVCCFRCRWCSATISAVARWWWSSCPWLSSAKASARSAGPSSPTLPRNRLLASAAASSTCSATSRPSPPHSSSATFCISPTPIRARLWYVAANAALAIFAYVFVVGEIKRVELRTV